MNSSLSSDYLHVRLFLTSVFVAPISKDETSSKSMSNIAKNIDIRGLSISLSHYSHKPANKDDLSNIDIDYSSLVRSTITGTVLNPLHIEITLLHRYDDDNDFNDLNSNNSQKQIISLCGQLSNLEFTPTLNQLQILKNTFDNTNVMKIRQKFAHLRPSSFPGRDALNSNNKGKNKKKNRNLLSGSSIKNNELRSKSLREWWRFAGNSVILILRGKGEAFKFLNTTLRMKLRNQYVLLYKKYVNVQLNKLVNNNNDNNNIIFTEEDHTIFDELHNLFSFDDLFLFRKNVLLGFQAKGVSFYRLKKAIRYDINKNDNITNSWTKMFSNQEVMNYSPAIKSSDDDVIDEEIYNLFQNKPDNTGVISWDIEMTIARFAVTLVNSNNSPVLIFTLALYGLQLEYESSSVDEKLLVVRIGSVRAYGDKGVELISCGGEADEYLNDFNIKKKKHSKLAVTLSLQYCETSQFSGAYADDNDSSDDNDYDDSDYDSDYENSIMKKQASKKLENISNKHIVAEMVVSELRLFWDSTTLLTLKSIYEDYLNFACPKSITLDASYLEQDRLLAAKISMFRHLRTINHLSKWSFDIVLHGITIIFPCSTLTSVNELVLNKETINKINDVNSYSKFLFIKLGLISLQGGDFLQEFLTSKPDISKLNSPIEEGYSQFENWKISIDKMNKKLIENLGCTIVHPLLYQINDIEFSLYSLPLPKSNNNSTIDIDFAGNNIDKMVLVSNITRVPWTSLGVLSPSGLTSHPDFTDIRLDSFCSPFSLAISTEDIMLVIGSLTGIIKIFDNSTINENIINDQDLISKKNHDIPRIKSLATLCKLKANFHIHNVDISLLTNEKEESLSYLTKILQVYRNTLLKRGAQCRVAEVNRRLVIHRIKSCLYLTLREADILVSNFTNDLLYQGMTYENALKSVNIYYNEHTSKKMIEKLQKEPILQLSITGLNLSIHELKYDFRCILRSQYLLVTDHNRYPVIEVLSKRQTGDCEEEEDDVKSPLSDISNSRASINKDKRRISHRRSNSKLDINSQFELNSEKILGKKPPLNNKYSQQCQTNEKYKLLRGSIHDVTGGEATDGLGFNLFFEEDCLSDNEDDFDLDDYNDKDDILSDTSAFSISYVLQDKICGWGKGGFSVRALYDRKKINNKYQNSLDEQLVTTVHSIHCLVSSTGLPKILDSVNKVSNQINQYLECIYTELKVSKSIPVMNSNIKTDNNNIQTKKIVTSPTPNQSTQELPIDTPPESQLIMRISMNDANVVLENDDHLLCQMLLTTVNTLMSSSLIEKGGKSTYVTSDTFDLFDLTDTGVLHQQSIWKKENDKDEENNDEKNLKSCPVLAVNITTGKEATSNVGLLISLVGLRGCILYRFIAEIDIFISQWLLATINNNSNFNSNIEDNNEFNNEADSSDDNDSLSSDDSDVSSVDSSTKGNEFNNLKLKSQEKFLSNISNSKKKKLKKEKKTSINESENKIKDETIGLTMFKIELEDVIVSLPRNSTSDDLVAASISSGSLYNAFVSKTWEHPAGIITSNPNTTEHKKGEHQRDNNDKINNDTVPLFFNIPENKWDFDYTQLQCNANNDSNTDITNPVSLTTSFQSLKKIAEANMNNSTLSGSVEYKSEINSSSDSDEDNFFDTIDDTNLSISFDCNQSYHDKQTLLPTSSPNEYYVSKDEIKGNIKRIGYELNSLQLYVAVAGPIMTASLPVSVEKREPNDNEVLNKSNLFEDSRKFNEVIDGNSVYEYINSIENDSNNNKNSLQNWRLATAAPFHLCIVTDYVPDKITNKIVGRTIVSDTKELSVLSLDVSMGELYLIESVWFDNISEDPVFLKENPNEEIIPDTNEPTEISEPTDISSTISKESPVSDKRGLFRRQSTLKQMFSPVSDFTFPTDDEKPIVVEAEPEPPTYGTKSYLEYICGKKCEFEFVLVRAEIELGCSMDVNYFLNDPFSLKYLMDKKDGSNNPASSNKIPKTHTDSFGGKPSNIPLLLGKLGLGSLCAEEREKVMFGEWKREAIPFAKICLSGLVLDSKGTTNVIELAASASKVQLYDIRIKLAPNQFPDQCFDNLVLNCQSSDDLANLKRYYAFPDFNYGFDLFPNIVDTSPDMPLRVTYKASTLTNWANLNVGIDKVDLNIMNLHLIWSISDFFSCYNSLPEYGHPGVLAYSMVPKEKIPYTGLDIRVFISKPHISVMEIPGNRLSPSMFIETTKGAFYRQIFDSDYSVKYELNLYDIALVMQKVYIAPNEARGSRGSAGSGRGIRTLVEYLSCGLVYHYDKPGKHSDILFNILPCEHYRKRGFKENKYNKVNKKDINKKVLNKDNVLEIPLNDDINFNINNIEVSAVGINNPLILYPLSKSKTKFDVNSCDVVSSYEDILFLISLVSEFIENPPPIEDLTSDEKLVLKKKIRKSIDRTMLARRSLDETIINNINAHLETNPNFNIDSVPDIENIRSRPQSGRFSNFKSPSLNENIDQDELPYKPPAEPVPEFSFFANVNINSLKFIVVDNVLGLHLPLIQLFIDKFELTYDTTPPHVSPSVSLNTLKTRRQSIDNLKADNRSLPKQNVRRLSIGERDDNKHNNLNNRSTKTIVKSFGHTVIWADYFNNIKKCWEPLLEKFEGTVLYENSNLRGEGCVIRILSSVHINISGPLLRTLDDTINMIESAKLAFEGRSNDNSNPQETPFYAVDSTDILVDRNEKQNIRISKKKSTEKTTPAPLKHSQSDLRKQCSLQNNIHFLSVLSELSEIEHLQSESIGEDVRVGFSILNLTGQPVRYLQQWEGGTKTVQYLNDCTRGLLNFVASTTRMRNNQIVEDSFYVQMDRGDGSNQRNRKKVIGHQVSLQISGFEWLPSVQADELGVKYEDLDPVLGRFNMFSKMEESLKWKVANALKLVAEVVPHNGGRMLQLRSVFSIKNNTNHCINLVAMDGESGMSAPNSKREGKDNGVPFLLHSGERFHIPLALLHRSSLNTNGSSLGYLYVKPSELSPVEQELGGRPHAMPSSVDYTMDPIDLHDMVERTADLFFSDNTHDLNSDEQHADVMMQLCCHINTVSRNKSRNKKNINLDDGEDFYNFNKLPPFSYNIEVQRIGNSEVAEVNHKKTKNLSKLAKQAGSFLFHKDKENVRHNAVYYSIVIHPPIILENLLPSGGIFELMHATQKRVLWSAFIGAGETNAIHTCTLDEPLVLLINLKYCRTLEGILIHKPRHKTNKEKGIKETIIKIKKTFHEFIDEDNKEDVHAVLTDTVGQRLFINIDNKEGGGGQRHIAVYCPYWIVNTSQFSLRIRQEGSQHLPAGTVTLQKDGTRPVVFSNSFSDNQFNGSDSNNRPDGKLPMGVGKIFPGRPGQLHHSTAREISNQSPLKSLLRELGFEETVDLSYMFNFHNDNDIIFGKKKVVVQIDDSDWSSSFSLDSVGVKQSISLDHADRGLLELGFQIAAAPGRLSKYTKIVRFMPRFIIVNNLNINMKVIQPTLFGGDGKEDYVSADCLRPFHLPDIEGDRALAIRVDGQWNRTVPFDIYQTGTYTLATTRHVDLINLPYVNTRGAPEYSVFFPPQEIGLWFETDWGERRIVVKGLKPGSFCAKQTDIQIGDVLLAIDDYEVSGHKFENAMTILKDKGKTCGCVVRLRTVEEKIRLIRVKAYKQSVNSQSFQRARIEKHSFEAVSTVPSEDENISENNQIMQELLLKIDIKLVEASIVIAVSSVDVNAKSEYQIDNQSVSHSIYYKQKGLTGNNWKKLEPGKSSNYIWEDPFKARKLLVRSGSNLLCPHGLTAIEPDLATAFNDIGNNIVKNPLGYVSGDNLKDCVTVSLDEIGFEEQLPLEDTESKLIITVVSNGPTKRLQISPAFNYVMREIRYSTEFINEQINLLETLKLRVDALTGIGTTKANNLNDSFDTIIGLSLTDIKTRLIEKQNRLIEIDSTFDEVESNFFKDLEIIKDIQEHLNNNNNKNPLTSYSPFTNTLGFSMESKNQLFVQVLEAKEVMPFVTGKKENLFCKLFFKADETLTAFQRRKYYQPKFTYVVDQTLDPTWIDQKFLFSIPEAAASQIRGFKIKVVLYSQGSVRIRRFVGQSDIQLSCLKNEIEVEGWFPLGSNQTSSSRLSTDPKKGEIGGSVGSIKLKLQWIHSNHGLTKNISEVLSQRISILKDQESLQRGHLKVLQHEEAYNKRQISDGNDHFLSPFVIEDNIPTSISNDIQKRFSIGNFTEDEVPKSLLYNYTMESSKKKIEVISNTVKKRASLIYKDRMDLISNKSSNALDSVREWNKIMNRRIDIENDNIEFNTVFEEECRRNFAHVHAVQGYIEITPLQALHLPESRKPLHVKMKYGNTSHSTFSVPPSADLSWYQDDDDELDINHHHGEDVINITETASKKFTKTQNDSLAKSFYVDTRSIEGPLRIKVRTENFPYKKEIARLDLSVFNILDSCISGEYYDRWYPLVPIDECISSEGEMGNFVQAFMSEQQDYSRFGYSACIKLRIRWISKDESPPSTQLYARLQLPSLSISIIDSINALEIMQLSLSGMEIRHATTERFTDSMVNLTWLQIDNQLPETIAPVMIAPAAVKYHQPVVRAHIRKNNLLSGGQLTSYDNFTLVVQELDLKLEQQTIISSWELLQNCLQVHRDTLTEYSHDKTESKKQKSFEKAIDLLGFATCTEIKRYDLLPTLVRAQSTNNKADPYLSTVNDYDVSEDESNNKLYIKNYCIFPFKMNASFITSPHSMNSNLSIREHQVSIREDDGALSTFRMFLWQVGEIVLDLSSTISDAPVYINGLIGSHMFETGNDLSKRLESHYFQYLMRQVYKIVGSLELMGNPYGLVSSLGTGVKDFLYEPALAFVASPTDLTKFGKGVMKGAVSLVSNTADGFIGTGTTITRSVGRGVAKLSMDETFTRNREDLLRPAISLTDAFLKPYKDISNGIYCGVVGLWRVPYNTFKINKPSTFLTGIVKGAAGLGAKPAVGVLDAITHTGDAFRDVIKILANDYIEPVHKCRLSNLFGPDGRILPYNFSEALGQHLLVVLDLVQDDDDNIGNAINKGGSMIKSAGYLLTNSSKKGNMPSSDAISLNNRRRVSTAAKRASTTMNSEIDPLNLNNKSIKDTKNSKINWNFLKLNFGKGIDNLSIKNQEFVVYTAVIHDSHHPGLDQVVIVSTDRVVVTDYQRKHRGSFLDKKFEKILSELSTPIIERSGGGATLTLRTKSSFTNKFLNEDKDKDNLDHNNELVIFCDYRQEEILITLSNCINTLLGSYDGILPCPSHMDVFEEDEDGLVKIGPWEYSRDFTEDSGVGLASDLETVIIKNKLNKSSWMYSIENNNNDDDISMNSGSIGGESRSYGGNSLPKDKKKAIVPEWLRDERDICINSHNELLEIYIEIENCLETHRLRLLEDNYGDEREDDAGRMIIIEQLQNGSISYATYQKERMAIIEREEVAKLKYQQSFAEGRHRRKARSNSLTTEIKSLNNSVSDSIRVKAAKVKDEIFESLTRGSKFVKKEAKSIAIGIEDGVSSLLTKNTSSRSSGFKFGKNKDKDNDGKEIKEKKKNKFIQSISNIGKSGKKFHHKEKDTDDDTTRDGSSPVGNAISLPYSNNEYEYDDNESVATDSISKFSKSPPNSPISSTCLMDDEMIDNHEIILNNNNSNSSKPISKDTDLIKNTTTPIEGSTRARSRSQSMYSTSQHSTPPSFHSLSSSSPTSSIPTNQSQKQLKASDSPSSIPRIRSVSPSKLSIINNDNTKFTSAKSSPTKSFNNDIDLGRNIQDDLILSDIDGDGDGDVTFSQGDQSFNESSESIALNLVMDRLDKLETLLINSGNLRNVVQSSVRSSLQGSVNSDKSAGSSNNNTEVRFRNVGDGIDGLKGGTSPLLPVALDSVSKSYNNNNETKPILNSEISSNIINISNTFNDNISILKSSNINDIEIEAVPNQIEQSTAAIDLISHMSSYISINSSNTTNSALSSEILTPGDKEIINEINEKIDIIPIIPNKELSNKEVSNKDVFNKFNKKNPRKYKILHDLIAVKDLELTVSEGDIVEGFIDEIEHGDTDKDYEDWTFVKLLNDTNVTDDASKIIGFVPNNLIEMIIIKDIIPLSSFDNDRVTPITAITKNITPFSPPNISPNLSPESNDKNVDLISNSISIQSNKDNDTIHSSLNLSRIFSSNNSLNSSPNNNNNNASKSFFTPPLFGENDDENSD
jgi:hypothetical protein